MRWDLPPAAWPPFGQKPETRHRTVIYWDGCLEPFLSTQIRFGHRGKLCLVPGARCLSPPRSPRWKQTPRLPGVTATLAMCSRHPTHLSLAVSAVAWLLSLQDAATPSGSGAQFCSGVSHQQPWPREEPPLSSLLVLVAPSQHMPWSAGGPVFSRASWGQAPGGCSVLRNLL